MLTCNIPYRLSRSISIYHLAPVAMLTLGTMPTSAGTGIGDYKFYTFNGIHKRIIYYIFKCVNKIYT